MMANMLNLSPVCTDFVFILLCHCALWISHGMDCFKPLMSLFPEDKVYSLPRQAMLSCAQKKRHSLKYSRSAHKYLFPRGNDHCCQSGGKAPGSSVPHHFTGFHTPNSKMNKMFCQ
ncbi:hypothetical protein GDO86_004302 [Hymenochirus boettgeri]|uniref:Secreted protein n=1 Tax=Hymenochirus boettgeri TaxID=247094 RepID=A0A8T2KCZ0_9PIPI|nr:hypothetical protein GDO86_004302 [Hymenochirus boettgeri]